MSPVQQRGLALWAALLSAVVCLGFLPVSRLVSVFVLLATLGLIVALWFAVSRRAEPGSPLCLDDLPEATYRQSVVLVCGDLPPARAQQSQVLTVTQGCWIRVEDIQALAQVARQVLWQRPDWGGQLSVMVSVCPQKHADSEVLTRRLLALRWQISEIRKETGHCVPLVLAGQAGSVMMSDMLWQAATSGEGVSVWREPTAPCSIGAWVTAGGAPAMQQQVLMNCLMNWCHQHVSAVFMDERPDIPAITPSVVLWGMGPLLAGSQASSVWTAWLSRRTAIPQVAGWQPVGTGSTEPLPLPDFVLSLLPKGQGLSPRSRAWRCALGSFTLAAIAALLCSGWNNRQLLHRMSFDIAYYDRIPADDVGLKANAIAVLRKDVAQLDNWARNGAPLRLSLGLYQGERMRMSVLDTIRSYPPLSSPLKPQPQTTPAPNIVRLDSLSLFEPGMHQLKPNSTNVLVNALVDIKVKPGWLIVVSGHTDNTGDPQLNQALSQQRAEAVRDWMRDAGGISESCFAVQGHGESRPAATNDTPEGRALNRRVEISLVPQADACRLPDAIPALSQSDGASFVEMEK